MNKPIILLVDDIPANIQIAVKLLMREEYETIVTTSGLDALKIVNIVQPDLILLDIMMPEMDGFETCIKLKELDKSKDIPVIFLTARTELEDLVKGFELGAVDYIFKPFHKEELLARVKTQLKLKKSDDLLKQGLTEAQKIAQLGSWVWDIKTNTINWSKQLYHILGISRSEIRLDYETFLKFIHPDDKECFIQSINKSLSQHDPLDLNHRIKTLDQIQKIVHTQGKIVLDTDGNPVKMLGTMQDITERKQTETQLKKLSLAIEQSINIVFITDNEGRIEYVNPMFELVTGYNKHEVIGQNPRILKSEETADSYYVNLWKTIKAARTWKGGFKNKMKDGSYYWVKGLVSPIIDEAGKVTNYLAIQEDISEKVLSEQKIQYLRNYDKKTGLLNRESFINILDDWLRLNKHGIFILNDIDEFKLVNEVYGHHIGDEFLKRVIAIIKEITENLVIREDYILGRFGGDEIVLAIQSKDEKEAIAIAEEIRKKVESFRFTSDSIRTTISSGIISFPDHGDNVSQLLSRVDLAVYRAKESGKNRNYLFTHEDKDIDILYTKLINRDRIIQALEEDLLDLWFQPILNLKDNLIHHYEVLVRMKGDDGNYILPGEFIPTAESLGLIDAIDRRVTEKTILYQAQCQNKGLDLSFAMNLSGKHLGKAELLDFLKEKIDEYKANPKKLVFEITETAAIQDLEKAIHFINHLKKLGCRFSLDDFGVGYTSFVYLREMNVDFIKIDGLFIRKLHEQKSDQGIVRAITTVARELDINTIAEFVEQPEVVHLLKAFHVDYAQGYLIGKPQPNISLEK